MEESSTNGENGKMKRKNFIKMSSLTAISALPALSIMSKLFASDKPTDTLLKDARIISQAYRLHVHQNLLNLEFYFINTREFKDDNKRTYLKAWYGQVESYMIVRLPQQHIMEQFFDFELTNNSRLCPEVYAQTKISGYSYLVFRILFPPDGTWQERHPNDEPTGYDAASERRIYLDYENLLDWDDVNMFRLVVRQNLDESVFNIKSYYNWSAAGPGIPDFASNVQNDATDGFFWDSKAPVDLHAYPHTFGDFDTVQNRNAVYGEFEKQPGIDYKFTTNPKVKNKLGQQPRRLIRDAAPFTLLELPYRIYLSPKLPNQDNYRFKWRFSRKPAMAFNVANELWMAALTIERCSSEALDKKASLAAKVNSPKKNTSIVSPVIRDEATEKEPMQLMILGHRRAANPLTGKFEDIDPTTGFLTLPTPKDAEDLVNLYRNYRLTAKTQRLAFSPIGVSTQIHFKNTHLEALAKNGGQSTDGIQLYEWNHHISFGRDQQVEVSRLVMCHETGHKFIWVRKASRVVHFGVAMLKYEEFLESFGDEIIHKNLINKEAVNSYNADTYMAGSCFTKTRYEKKRKRIKSVFTLAEGLDKVSVNAANSSFAGNGCPTPLLTPMPNLQSAKKEMEKGMDQVLAFWAIDPTVSTDITKPNSKDPAKGYDLSFEMIVTDWEGVEHVIKKKICVVTGALSEFTKQTELKIFEAKKSVKEAEKKYQDYLASGKNDLDKTIEHVTSIIKAVNDKTDDGHWDRLYKVFNHSVQDFAQHYEDLLPRTISVFEQKLKARYSAQADEWMNKVQLMINHMLTDIEDKVIREIDKQYDKLLRVYIDDVTVGPGRALHVAILDYTKDKQQALDSLYDSLKKVIAGTLGNAAALQASIKANTNGLYKNVDAIQLEIQNYITNYLDPILGTKPHLAIVKGQLVDIRTKINTLLSHYLIWAQDFFNDYYSGLPAALRNELKNWNEACNQIIDVIAKAKTYNNSIRNKIDLGRNKVTLAVNEVAHKAGETAEDLERRYNKEIARMETEYVVLRGHFRKVADKQVVDFFNEHACFPQLNTAKVYIKEVNELVNKQVPVKLKYAHDYLKNQVSAEIREIDENVAQVIAEIKGDTRALIQTATSALNAELANVANVEIANRFLSTAKHNVDSAKEELSEAYKAIRQNSQEFQETLSSIEKQIKEKQQDLVLMGESFKNQMHDYVNKGKVDAQRFLEDMKVKILGAIPLTDVLGDNFPLPVLIRNLKEKTIVYNFTTSQLQPARIGPFAFHNSDITDESARGGAVFMIHVEKPLAPERLKEFKAWAHLQNFAVGVFDDRIVIGFKKLSIYSDQNTKNKTDVQISNVLFNKELNFFKKMAEAIELPAGMELDIKPTEIAVRYSIPLPTISSGMFNLANLKFISAVKLSFGKGGSSPLTFRFSINRANDKFLMNVGIFGGRGHFEIEFAPKYMREIDTSMDFGGILYLSLGGIATGMAYLLAGIRYRYERDDYGRVTNEFYAIISCGAELTVFGIISIAVTFIVYLRYVASQGKAMLEGVASVSCSIKIGFFKKSFTLTFRKVLAGTDSGGSDASYNNYIPGVGRLQLSNLLYFPPSDDDKDCQDYNDRGTEEDKNAIGFGYGRVSKKYREQNRWKIYCNSFSTIGATSVVTKDLYTK